MKTNLSSFGRIAIEPRRPWLIAALLEAEAKASPSLYDYNSGICKRVVKVRHGGREWALKRSAEYCTLGEVVFQIVRSHVRKYLVPYVAWDWVVEDGAEHLVLAQLWAGDTNVRSRAMGAVFSDAHDGNIRTVKGKPRMIDWGCEPGFTNVKSVRTTEGRQLVGLEDIII